MANPPRFRPWLWLTSLGPIPPPPQPTFRTPSPTPQPSQPNANAAPIVTPTSPLALQTSKGKGTNHRKVLDSEDYDKRAITISGENKGAYMKIIQPSNKPNYLHKNGNSKDYELEGLGNANRKDKSQKERTLFSPPMALYVNSNVQGVNNSVLYHTTCSTHDPGVHLSL
ncbi:hypothetical protein TanjilG_11183 [Lupinus angustifolius]|uniref:Uncharacterized protein n=1 Tax=Lupinus angustifolius TaxID=3871 RepID=A0A1J7HIT7_LUPAN|nr:hypothetical protein TanjilG_11183 [Lupinus angustifolius]